MFLAERSRLLIVAALLVAGAAVRLVNLDQSVLSFHPTRQFRSAIIARACYYERTPAIPDWARRVAVANRGIQPAAELTIMEGLACAAYQLAGRESLAFPRIFASIFWLLGGIPLYAVARRFATVTAALVGVSTYVFLPYAIVASRAFQPDPLMTSASLWAVWALVRYCEARRWQQMSVAAFAIAIAALIKPMSVFFTVPAAAGLAIGTNGFRSAWALSTWMPVALGLAPAVAYYGYSAVFGTLARDQMNLRFVPALLPTAFFWGGLWRMIGRVLGAPLFVISVIGTASAAARGKSLLVALWIGYFLFAVAFTYHMPTHDYYHLPAIALTALAASAFFTSLERWLTRTRSATLARVVSFAAVLVIAVGGTAAAMPKLYAGDPDAVARFEQIGALAEHHTRVLFLDREYGYPLMYYGQVAGDSWPSTDDLAAEGFGGAARLDARARYARDFDEYGARYFIVTDLPSLYAQPDLQQFLREEASVVRLDPAYHVYRLAEP